MIDLPIFGTPLKAPFASSAAVFALDREGRVLLQLRDDMPGVAQAGKWCPFGGEIEGDETPEEGAARELEEETGITRPSTAFTPFAQLYTEADRPLLLHIFTLRADFGAVDVRVAEGAGFGFFTEAQLARLDVIDYYRPVFNALCGRQIFSDG